MSTHQEYLATAFGVLNGYDPKPVFAFIAGARGCIWRGQYTAKVKAACRLRDCDGGSLGTALRNLDAVDAGEHTQLLEPINLESPS